MESKSNENQYFFLMSERVERIRRNLVVLSSASFVFSYFGLELKSAGVIGLSVDKLPTDKLYIILFVLIFYEGFYYFSRYLTEKKEFHAKRAHKFAISPVDIVHRVDPFLDQFPKGVDNQAINYALNGYGTARSYGKFKSLLFDEIIPLGLMLLGVVVCLNEIFELRLALARWVCEIICK